MALPAEAIRINTRDTYAHLPPLERPRDGEPRINVVDALLQHQAPHEVIGRTIRTKRERTMATVPENMPGHAPSFLTRPTVHRTFPETARQKFAEMMAELIRNVYGDGYPLPNKQPDFNLSGMMSGNLLPYLAVTGPADVVGNNGRIYDEPDILTHPEVRGMAASAIIRGDSGFAELGRFARRQEASYIDGGAIILEMVYDWMRNRLGLLEGVHTLYADMRAANTHDHSPHSGNVQNLLLGHAGMKIVAAAPMYDVNGIEPMMKVALFRDQQEVRMHNAGKKIYLPSGSNTELLSALWEHQLNEKPSIEIVEESSTPSNARVQVEYHGEHIYTGMQILPETQTDDNPPLNEVLGKLPEDAPVFFAQVEVESSDSISTQRVLMEKGFVHCGIMPGQHSEFLADPGDRSKGVRQYTAPITVFMVKLGSPVLSGKKPLAPAYYPTPAEAGGKDLHGGDHMRKLLYAHDAAIRSQIKKNDI